MGFFRRGALIERTTITATSGTPVTLTNSSTTFQYFTGSTAQTVNLPSGTTMDAGQKFYIVNNASSLITVYDGSGAFLAYVIAGSERIFQIESTSTTAGTWSVAKGPESNGSPLKIYANVPATSVLNITAQEIMTVDGTGLSAPPLSSTVPTFATTTIDFQALTTSGGTVNISWPTVTSGFYYRVGFTLLAGNTLQALFSSGAATLGAVPNAGSLFSTGGIPVGWIDLQATSTTQFKTAGSSSSVIENAVAGASTIHNFGSGGSGGGSGTGSGIGDDLDSVAFRASFNELFTEGTTSSNCGVNASAGFTNATYSSAKQMWSANYDASRTASQTYTFTVTSANATVGATYTNNGATFTVITTISAGTSLLCYGTGAPLSSGTLTKASGTGDATITFSAVAANAAQVAISVTPSFTVAVGDVVVNLSTGEVKKISTVTSQTLYTLEGAFYSTPFTQAVCISQAVHTKDIYNFAVDGVAISSAFGSSTFSEILVDYKDNATSNSNLWTPNVAPFAGFTASPDNASWTTEQLRATNETDTVGSTMLPSAGTSLYLRFFSAKTTGTGTINLINYRAMMQKSAAVSSGDVQNQAYGMTNVTGSQSNLTMSVVGGKSVATLTWSYPVGVNSGLAYGSIDVTLNGQRLPRYVSSSLTSDAYFTEYAANAIQLDRDYSGQSLNLQIIQRIQVVDSNTQNTTNIAYHAEFFSDGFQPFINQSEFVINPTTTIGSPVAGTFYSSIIGRASIQDFSQDLKPRFGIERIMTQSIQAVQNEFGPNGEPVWSSPNDLFGQIRYVGAWTSATTSNGTRAEANIVNDYVEIVFYGTGLNILTSFDNGAVAYDYRATVDGGTEGGQLLTSTPSAVVQTRLFDPNVVLPVVSTLSPGIHTVKIRLNSLNGLAWLGFEVINQYASGSNLVTVNPSTAYIAGNKLALTSQATHAYNSPVVGSTGGRVVEYISNAGIIGQAFTQNASSPSYLTSSSHTNEEVIRTHHWREFSASRADDFSVVNSTSLVNAAFTLEDGTTTLTGYQINNPGSPGDIIQIATVGTSFLTLTFVGTGLDIFQVCESGATRNALSVTVDGTSVGNLTTYTASRIVKIASGLPYGTHVVKFMALASGSSTPNITRFTVYQPKTPSIPSGAVQIGSYNVVATYSSSGLNNNYENFPVGTIFKSPIREHVYSGPGTFSLSGPAAGSYNGPGGWSIFNSTNGNVTQITFFGTGVTFPFSSNSVYSVVYTIAIDGVNNATGVVYGGAVNSGSGNYTLPSGLTLAYWVSLQGLTCGVHTVTITRNDATAGSQVFNGVCITTPIHSPKSNLYADLQNALPVGSCGISDDRKLTPVKDVFPAQKAWAQAVGILSAPSTSAYPTPVPMPDMSCTIKTSGGALQLIFIATATASQTAAYIEWQFYVDGVSVGVLKDIEVSTAGNDAVIADTMIVPASAGVHKVDVYWCTNAISQTISMRNLQRVLTVREL